MALPSKKLLIINTRLAPHEVRQRLKGAIAKPRGLDFLAPRPEPYKGKYKTDRFHIRRQGIFKHPYRPTIIGKFMNDERGTQVRLLMRPPLRWGVTLVFSMTSLGLAILTLFDLGVDIYTNGSGSFSRLGIALLLSLGLVILSYILARGNLIQQYEKETEYFCDLLEAEDIQESTIPIFR